MNRPAHGWDEAYQQPAGPPWDIGRPQPVLSALAGEGLLDGPDVLDAGCGTGEHALMLAARGARVTAVDLSEVAIGVARTKAAERGLAVSFASADILTVALPADSFDVVVDSGLFHSFDDADRGRYVGVLRGRLRPGGLCCVMCFSDREPGDWGPRRVTRDELEAAFAAGWAVERLEPSTFEINPVGAAGPTVAAWLGLFRRDQ
jgi:2-polyprenyl-3-methyl-5-hydroxy-6-metoxy-1,4-benzoquinol methylase